MTLARKIADFVTETSAVPRATSDMARRALLDLVTAAAAGFDTPGGRAARAAADVSWGPGPAACWFSTARLTVPGAAFANAAIASMLDLDDGHRAAAGHPGASIIPAVLATSEAYGADAVDCLSAIALGYEVAVRIAAARDLASLDTLVTGPWCGQGAAVAAAWLRGLSAEQTAEALAIAGSSAPNMAAVGYSRVMGNHVKEGIPWATATGLAAVDLASAGFTGPLDILDNAAIFDSRRLTGGLGDDWLIEGIYFKPYSCCRWAHAPIDALLDLLHREQLDPEEIRQIEVQTFQRTLRLNNDIAPANLEAAQYSVPFCLALAALRGAEALLPLTESALGDRAVLALAERVTITVDPTLESMFPAAVPGRVTLGTAAGSFTHAIDSPKGEPSNPMTWADLLGKFETVTADLLDPHHARALLRGLESLGAGDLAPLLSALARPLGVRAAPAAREPTELEA